MLKLIKKDPWLKPYQEAIVARYKYYSKKVSSLTYNGSSSLSEFASGYLYFGLHREAKRWIFREWAPNATDIFVIGDFNQWQRLESYKLKPIGNGVFEGFFPEKALGKLFNRPNIGTSRRKQIDGTPPKGYQTIDELFD